MCNDFNNSIAIQKIIRTLSMHFTVAGARIFFCITIVKNWVCLWLWCVRKCEGYNYFLISVLYILLDNYYIITCWICSNIGSIQIHYLCYVIMYFKRHINFRGNYEITYFLLPTIVCDENCLLQTQSSKWHKKCCMYFIITTYFTLVRKLWH